MLRKVKHPEPLPGILGMVIITDLISKPVMFSSSCCLPVWKSNLNCILSCLLPPSHVFSATLWDPMDCSPPDSSVHGIFQARTLEWVVISFCRGSPQLRARTLGSCVSCAGRQILYHCVTTEALSPIPNPLSGLSRLTAWTGLDVL